MAKTWFAGMFTGNGIGLLQVEAESIEEARYLMQRATRETCMDPEKYQAWPIDGPQAGNVDVRKILEGESDAGTIRH